MACSEKSGLSPPEKPPTLSFRAVRKQTHGHRTGAQSHERPPIGDDVAASRLGPPVSEASEGSSRASERVHALIAGVR